MTSDLTVIFGIEIPSTDPLFVGVIVGELLEQAFALADEL
jgi:hypothetical protein